MELDKKSKNLKSEKEKENCLFKEINSIVILKKLFMDDKEIKNFKEKYKTTVDNKLTKSKDILNDYLKKSTAKYNEKQIIEEKNLIIHENTLNNEKNNEISSISKISNFFSSFLSNSNSNLIQNENEIIEKNFLMNGNKNKSYFLPKKKDNLHKLIRNNNSFKFGLLKK